MLSVLPRYIITFKEDSFRLCCDKARSKTSSVPEPLSRRTNGIFGKSSGVISSWISSLVCACTTATSSSCKNEVYFKLGRRKIPSTKPKSIRCSCKAVSTPREFPLIRERLTCGNLAMKFPNKGGRTYWAIVVLAPSLNSPIYSLCNKCISYSSCL